jgi:CRISPR-associated exonuclease Cas4
MILPHIPQAAKDSWFSSVDLRQGELPELDVSGFAASAVRQAAQGTRTSNPPTLSRQSEKG